MTVADELFKIAERLEAKGSKLNNEKINEPLTALIKTAERVAKSWSGSWLGYHSQIYYAGLTEIPPGARFSQEWGLMDSFAIQDTVGDWQEYRFDDVVSYIYKEAGDPDISSQKEESTSAKEIFEESKYQILSLLSEITDVRKDDNFLKDILGKIDKKKIFSADDFESAVRPTGQMMSRDMPAIQAGLKTPPHIYVFAKVQSIKYPFIACDELSKLTRRVASHIKNIEKRRTRDERIGTNVFIGHGRSFVWRGLKDFIQDRMHLPWDEFNRVPVAGVTNIARLSQMLDESAIAFLIMTAEDEQEDGKQHARQNVIHEAGLFQGRLGFERAIILLENGCEQFSNIQGLGQIRFPKGNISAVFEEIRRVLEREGLVEDK